MLYAISCVVCNFLLFKNENYFAGLNLNIFFNVKIGSLDFSINTIFSCALNIVYLLLCLSCNLKTNKNKIIQSQEFTFKNPDRFQNSKQQF